MISKDSNTKPLWLHLAVVIALLGHAPSATAGEQTGWQLETTLYGWYAGMDGTILSPGPVGGEGDLEVDAADILDNLQMAFMGTMEARHGKWAVVTDLVYLNMSNDASISLKVGPPPGRTVNATADLDFTSWVVNTGIGYDLAEGDWGKLGLIGGVRYLSVDIDGSFGLGGPYPLNRSEFEEFWNGFVGLRGAIHLNENWYLPYYADLGTGDSDLTWQLFAGIGYRFGWGDVRAGYRYLGFEQDGEGVVEDMSISGPAMGVVFRF